MSPAGIVSESLAKGLSIIGITDHNSTRQCRIVTELADETGLCVLPGVELTTREEVHRLADFESLEAAASVQRWIDAHLQIIQNKPEFFGYQVVVDRHEQVVYEEERLLIAALDSDIHETIAAVTAHNGLVICAHVDKGKNSLFSQLGIMPEGLEVDALEVAAAKNRARITRRYPETVELSFVSSSDAHYAEDIASATTTFTLEKPDFHEIRLALSGRDGRKVTL
jgi:PHP family Zn ribbon phosphoesterase